jgi:enamine deaminase RidA (YjgF/YER057c/UK114 family)
VSFADRLSKLGHVLPTPAAPVANYVPYKLTGRMLYLSGMIPVVDGSPLYTGRLGENITIEQGQACARQCILNSLAWVNEALSGDMERVFEIIQLRGFIACTAEFTQHPQVMNGASDLLVEVFGDRGKHTRVAVGSISLPLGVPVEIDMTLGLG